MKNMAAPIRIVLSFLASLANRVARRRISCRYLSVVLHEGDRHVEMWTRIADRQTSLIVTFSLA
jgi:hypothetical protein